MSRVVVVERVAKVHVLQPEPLAAVVRTQPQGPAGVPGPPGPAGTSSISDATALGSLTSAATDALFLLAANSAGTFARKVPLSAVGRSLLGTATALAGRSALGIANVSTGAAGNVYLGGLDDDSFPLTLNLWNDALGVYEALTVDDTGWYFPATLHVNGPVNATAYTGDGSGLTGIAGGTDASALITGTLADARLSSNVALKNAANVFLPAASGGVSITLRPNAADTGTQSVLLAKDAYGNDALSIQMVDNYALNLNYYGNDCNFNSANNGQTVFVGTTQVDELRKRGEGNGVRLVLNYSSSTSKLARFYTGGSVNGYLVCADNTVSGNNLPFLASSTAAYTGPSFRANLLSSTATEREAGDLTVVWATSTDATRASRLTLSAYYTSTAQEGVRVEGNSGGARLGFFGGSGAAKPTVTGSRGSNAALASLLTALAGLGLLTDSSS